MFSRRAASAATLIAGTIGTIASYVVAYHTSIGFMWPSTFGLVSTIVVGLGLTMILNSRPTAEALRLTWWAVMRGEHLPEPEHVRHLR